MTLASLRPSRPLHDIAIVLGAIAFVAIKAAALVACGAGMVGGLVTAAILMGVTK